MVQTKKTALVTGGLRGIGLGISKALLNDGYSLAVCGTRSFDEIENNLADLRANRTGDHQTGEPLVTYYSCDVGKADERGKLMESLKKDFESINVLVNNAGVAPKVRNDILNVAETDFEWLMKINLQGPFFLTQQIANWMIQRKQNDAGFDATIVNISSVSATTVSVNRPEYCISKAGVSMATQLWAVRLAEFGIPVFEIQPGIIESDMTAGVKEKYSKLIREGLVPQQRWGTPDDIGRVTVMLARGDLCLHLTNKQVVKLEELLGYNLRIILAYLMKEDFDPFWAYRSGYWAGKFLEDWCRRAMRSKIEPMKKFVNTLRSHKE